MTVRHVEGDKYPVVWTAQYFFSLIFWIIRVLGKTCAHKAADLWELFADQSLRIVVLDLTSVSRFDPGLPFFDPCGFQRRLFREERPIPDGVPIPPE